MSDSSKRSYATAHRFVGLPRGSRRSKRPLIFMISDWESSARSAVSRLVSLFSSSAREVPPDYAATCPDKLEPPSKKQPDSGVYDFSSGRRLDI